MSPGAVKGGRKETLKALHRQKILAHLLPSRLYCRYRSCTGSCARGARGLYRRSGISPCPEDICSLFSFRNRQYTTFSPKMQAASRRSHTALPRWAVELRPVVFAWHLSDSAWGAKKVGEKLSFSPRGPVAGRPYSLCLSTYNLPSAEAQYDCPGTGPKITRRQCRKSLTGFPAAFAAAKALAHYAGGILLPFPRCAKIKKENQEREVPSL